MKSLRAIIILFVLILGVGCSSSTGFNNYLEEVRYSTGTIHNIDRNYVTLADGSVFKLRRFLIAVNMSPVIIVLPSYSDESFSSYDFGYMFVDGSRYEITNYSSIQANFFRYGFYEYAEDIDYKTGIISVTDGTKWKVEPEYLAQLKEWTKGTDILVDGNNHLIFNLRKISKVEANKIKENKKGKSKG